MLRPMCYILSLLVLFMVGCTTDPHVAEQIRHAESIVVDLPDSALGIMRSISPNVLRNKHDAAHYQLVYSEAIYYSGIDSDSDSITRPMAEYYMTSDNHAERARALYMHAYVLKTGGKEAEAMLSLMEAESSCNHIDNPRLAGIIHRTKGEIYGDECLFNNALAEYQAAKVNFIKAGLEYHSAYADYDIGRIFNCLQKFDDAETYQKRALKYAESIDSPELIAEIAFALLRQYLSTEEYDKLVSTLRYYEQHLIKYSFLYHIYKGIYYAHHGDMNKAIANMELAHQHGCDPLLLEYAYYSIYRNVNDYKMALQYLERIIEQQNKLVLSSLNAPILNLQIDIAKQDQQNLKNNIKRTRIIYTLLVVVLCAIIVICIITIRYRHKLQQQEIEENMALVVELQNRIVSNESILLDQQNIIGQLFSSHYDTFNRLSSAYYECHGMQNEKQKIHNEVVDLINSIATDSKAIKEMESFVDRYKDNVMTKLNQAFPDLGNHDKNLFMYLVLGFSARAISIFMKEKIDVVYNRKSRLKQKISRSDSQYKELLLELID
ncbi:MAG: hypothetical protein J6Q36_07555 [Alistipes sp.]|nr:hypothetical protein [Alistipes sp.]